MSHSAKKSLGQNFLVDDNVARKILHTFSPRESELVLEIGPGRGALTRYLDELGVETVAVELDEELAVSLRNEFGTASSITVLQEDILQFDLASLGAGPKNPTRVLGNIPYNITSPLIFHLIDQREHIRDVFFMMQKDVANRFTAKPGNKSYGILTVLLQTFADATFEFTVSQNVFRPRPRVESAVVSFVWHTRWQQQIPDVDLYRVVVRTAFGKRRKILRNALAYLPFSEFDPDSLDFNTNQRAEELSVRDFILLTREIARKYDQYPGELVSSEL